MSDNFCVSFCYELVSVLFELVLQSDIVFNDAVMYDDDLASAVAVGMRVFLRRASMRGPTGVANTIATLDRRLPQGFFEIAEFARSAADLDHSALIDDRNARGVIAAVFESLKPVENQGHDLLGTDVSNYSTHSVFSNIGKVKLMAKPTSSTRLHPKSDRFERRSSRELRDYVMVYLGWIESNRSDEGNGSVFAHARGARTELLLTSLHESSASFER